MPRWFNVAGPCRTDIHLMLPPTTRVPEILRLIEQQNYFVIHAPRQVGNTTAIRGLAGHMFAGCSPGHCHLAGRHDGTIFRSKKSGRQKRSLWP